MVPSVFLVGCPWLREVSDQNRSELDPTKNDWQRIWLKKTDKITPFKISNGKFFILNMEFLDEKIQTMLIDAKIRQEVGIVLNAVDLHRSHLIAGLKVKNLFGWVWPSEAEFVKKVKMRALTAKLLNVIKEDEFKKIEFYISEYEEDLKKFWNIVRALDQENREFFGRSWAVGMEFNDHKKGAIKVEELKITLPIEMKKELKIGKMPRFMPSSSKEMKKRRIEDEDTGNPLRAHEIEEKKMWIKKLEGIVDRAGECATVAKLYENCEEDDEDIKITILGKGAFRSISGHVRRWIKFEKWAELEENKGKKYKIYPPDLEALFQYLRYLDRVEKCGPSVPDAFLGTVRWVGLRIGMAGPDLKCPMLTGYCEKVAQERGRELKEAPAVPKEFIEVLEKVVMNDEIETSNRILAWWFLCMIFGSLRCDDAIHVRPSSLKLDEATMRGVAWQTKTKRVTARVRKVRRFAVFRGGFTDLDWLAKGLELFQKHCMNEPDRDFWIPLILGPEKFDETFWVDYKLFYDWLKLDFVKILEKYEVDGKIGGMHDWRSVARTLTPHSGRVVIPDMAACNGSQPYMINAQCGWKDSMIDKYGRSGDKISIKMVREVMEDARHGANERNREGDGRVPDPDTEGPSPIKERDQCDEGEESDLEDRPVFFAAQAKSGGKGSSKGMVKLFHVRDLKDPRVTACKNIKITDLEIAGSDAPERICTGCSFARPEIRRVL